ncbi:MAG: PEP-CTERM sorting domain-containing protein [Aquabacterium sp.]
MGHSTSLLCCASRCAIHGAIVGALALSLTQAHAANTTVTFSTDATTGLKLETSLHGRLELSKLGTGFSDVVQVKVSSEVQKLSDAADVSVGRTPTGLITIDGLSMQSVVADLPSQTIQAIQYSGAFRMEAPRTRDNGRLNPASFGGWLEMSDLSVNFVTGEISAMLAGDHDLATARIVMWSFNSAGGLPTTSQPFDALQGLHLADLNPWRTAGFALTDAGYNAMQQGLGLTAFGSSALSATFPEYGTLSVTAVPEPASWALMGLGLVGVFGVAAAARQPRPGTRR